jgi:hypothetical protein
MSTTNLAAYGGQQEKTLQSSQSSTYTAAQPKLQSNPYGGGLQRQATGGSSNVKVSALLNPPQASNPKLAYQESNSQSESNEDVMIAKIKELELENKKLKMGAPYGGASQAEDKNWLNSGFGGNTS